MHTEAQPRLRIDKWLWAARFYKTRSLSAQAVSGGRVHLNGERVKPAHTVRVGDLVQISLPREDIEVEVAVLAGRRGPASVAVTLYRETEGSVERREAERERRRLMPGRSPAPDKRPDKRARRQLARLLGREP